MPDAAETVKAFRDAAHYLDQENDALREKVRDLEDDVRLLESEKADVIASIEQDWPTVLRDQIVDLRANVRALEAQVSELTREKSGWLAQLNATVQEFEQDRARYEDRIRELTQERTHGEG